MRAFTLIETLVTLFIFGLIIILLFSMIAMLYTTHSYAWQQSAAIDEARRGIKTMVQEIRQARSGDNGSFAVEKADDKEFIFYSDIDKDGKTERVRYFLGIVSSGSQTQQCVTFTTGGSCTVNFSNFLQGTLKSAQVKVSVEGDLGQGSEYADIYADGQNLGKVCQSGCSDCAGTWQGTTVFDVSGLAADNFIQLTADATSQVNNNCNWQEPHHALKASFELSWEEEITAGQHELKKGVIKPTSSPVDYPPDQEEVSIISSYVRNSPPIFEYFDATGDKIIDYPARLADTKLMKVFLVVNIDPNRLPQDFELESYVQLRNLKEE